MACLLSYRSREGTLRPTAKHAGQPEGTVPAMVGAAPGEQAAGEMGSGAGEAPGTAAAGGGWQPGTAGVPLRPSPR